MPWYWGGALIIVLFPCVKNKIKGRCKNPNEEVLVDPEKICYGGIHAKGLVPR